MTEAIEQGLRGCGGSEDWRLRARLAIELWLERGWCEPEIRALVERQAFSELLDAFRTDLPFGTGGRRGPMGPGPNRINRHTVGETVVGHVRAAGLGSVLIGYDVRHGSRTLARHAAQVYAGLGVEVWLAPAPIATPELSFAIRELGADAGAMLTASHNPPQDNGIKLYDGRGCQILDELARQIEAAAEPASCDAPLDPRPFWVRDAYLSCVVDTIGAGPRGSVVFSSLHGVGHWTVGPALERAGFQVFYVADQCEPDADFPSVGGIANPEDPRTLDRAIALADEVGAGIALCTDPDADRIGCALKRGSAWRVLTGNEIALLVVDRVLRAGETLIQTRVTSPSIAALARARNAFVVDDLPVGFKYIADAIDRVQQFAVGVEESHGVLTTSRIRDKCAATGALALADAAAQAAHRGTSLLDRLDALCGGPEGDAKGSLVLRGAEGAARLDRLLAALREQPPARLAGQAVLFVGWRGAVCTLRCSEGRVMVRPSGTEPKLKLYGHGIDAEDLVRDAISWLDARA